MGGEVCLSSGHSMLLNSQARAREQGCGSPEEEKHSGLSIWLAGGVRESCFRFMVASTRWLCFLLPTVRQPLSPWQEELVAPSSYCLSS